MPYHARMPITTRPETASDIAAIEALTLAAFDQHPHHAPGAPVTEHHIIAGLREAGDLALSLVAVDGNQLIGHCSFSPIRIQHQASDWLVLAPVSVAPARQRQGIGGKLIRSGLQILTARGVPGVVVLGDPGYYGRFGFHARHALVHDGAPAEYFFAQALQDLGAAIPGGSVQFHPAFAG